MLDLTSLMLLIKGVSQGVCDKRWFTIAARPVTLVCSADGALWHCDTDFSSQESCRISLSTGKQLRFTRLNYSQCENNERTLSAMLRPLAYLSHATRHVTHTYSEQKTLNFPEGISLERC